MPPQYRRPAPGRRLLVERTRTPTAYPGALRNSEHSLCDAGPVTANGLHSMRTAPASLTHRVACAQSVSGVGSHVRRFNSIDPLTAALAWS